MKSSNTAIQQQLSTSPTSEPLSNENEARKPIKLLPRSLPVVKSEATYNTSIFGTGKPRDINNPEIRKLEERVEKTLTISTPTSALADESQKE